MLQWRTSAKCLINYWGVTKTLARWNSGKTLSVVAGLWSKVFPSTSLGLLILQQMYFSLKHNVRFLCNWRAGEVLKSWRRRWFVLKDGKLFWFKSDAVHEVGIHAYWQFFIGLRSNTFWELLSCSCHCWRGPGSSAPWKHSVGLCRAAGDNAERNDQNWSLFVNQRCWGCYQ